MKGLFKLIMEKWIQWQIKMFHIIKKKKKHYKSSTVTLILNVTLLRFPWIPAVNEKMAAGIKKGSVWTQNW